jgi:hypothetical protein
MECGGIGCWLNLASSLKCAATIGGIVARHLYPASRNTLSTSSMMTTPISNPMRALDVFEKQHS